MAKLDIAQLNPLKDTAGKLWSLQWIAPDGTKRFLAGGRKKGCFHRIGDLEDGKPIIVVEGICYRSQHSYGYSTSNGDCI